MIPCFPHGRSERVSVLQRIVPRRCTFLLFQRCRLRRFSKAHWHLVVSMPGRFRARCVFCPRNADSPARLASGKPGRTRVRPLEDSRQPAAHRAQQQARARVASTWPPQAPPAEDYTYTPYISRARQSWSGAQTGD
jgi:hypothetical protein